MKPAVLVDARMEALRARIAASGLPRPSRDTMLIATWNIRELGRRPRRPESLRYIAGILSHFDLVSAPFAASRVRARWGGSVTAQR